jgi:hypothetical protein
MNSIIDILIKLSELSAPIMLIIRSLCALAGIIMVGNSLYQLYVLSNPQASKTVSPNSSVSVTGAIIQLIIAALLISFSSSNNILGIASSMVGFDSNTFTIPGSLSNIGGNANVANFTGIRSIVSQGIQAILGFVGVVAIVKALFSIRRIGMGLSKESMVSPLFFIISGSLCLNIVEFCAILDTSLGVNFSRFFI